MKQRLIFSFSMIQDGWTILVQTFWKCIKMFACFFSACISSITATNLANSGSQTTEPLSKPRSQGDCCPMLGNAMSKQSYERYWKIGANARIPCPVNLLKTNCTSPSLKQTRLQHSLRKKAVVQKPNDNQLKCGPLQHTPALSFKPHPNSATNLTKPSWPFVFQQHPVQWDAWSFLNAAPLKRQGVHFTFQKVTHISFSHCSETVQIIQVCILNNLNIYIYIYDIWWYIYVCILIRVCIYSPDHPIQLDVTQNHKQRSHQKQLSRQLVSPFRSRLAVGRFHP